MKIREFINHIKHKSLKITIYSNILKPKVWFEGTIGEYSTSVVKSKLDNEEIQLIVPTKNGDLDIRISDRDGDYKISPLTPKGRI
jgi:hypothetical protein